MQVLQQYISVDWTTLTAEDIMLLSSFLELTSQVLNWDFHHSVLRSVILNTEASTVRLKPPKSYAPTFLDPTFLDLFFKLLGKVCSNESHMHYVIQCLTQLASLTKPVFSTDQEQQTYTANFVSGILTYVSR